MTKQKLFEGQQVQALNPQRDEDEEGREREAPIGMAGRVTSADHYPAQGWTYGIVFENGCWVFLIDGELDEIKVTSEEPCPECGDQMERDEDGWFCLLCQPCSTQPCPDKGA